MITYSFAKTVIQYVDIKANSREEAELFFLNHQHHLETGFHLSFLPSENDDVHFFEMILVNDTNEDVRFEIKLFLQNELYMHLRNRLQRRYLYRLGDLAMDELKQRLVLHHQYREYIPKDT